jgi:hypothetical protein
VDEGEPVVTATLSERLQALARWEERFASPGFSMGRWAVVTPRADGVLQMPWYEYSETALVFVADASAFGWVVAFDWMRWAAAPEAQRMLTDPRLVARASEADLVRLLTTIIRGDRFSEGRIASAYESGLLLAIVARARQLGDDLRRPPSDPATKT